MPCCSLAGSVGDRADRLCHPRTSSVLSRSRAEGRLRLRPTSPLESRPVDGSIVLQLSEIQDHPQRVIGVLGELARCAVLEVEPTGLEPVTSGLQSQRSPN